MSRTADTAAYAFTIRDTGIGMTQDFIDNHLFEAFSQEDNAARSQYGGTGLGMSIVNQLVQKMNGTITVESTVGEGSCFTVTLPFAIDHDPPAAGPEKEASADLHGKRLLVVEDNELNMEIVEFMLKAPGPRSSRRLTAKRRARFAADPAGYDAILMDLMMPVMDGSRRGQGHPRQRADPCRDCAHHRHERQRLRRGREEMPGFRHERPHQQAAVQGCHAAHDCTVCINLPGTMP